MSDADIVCTARQLIATLDAALYEDLGPRMTCSEAEAVADLYRAMGDEDGAELFLFGHSQGDNEDDDWHHGMTDPRRGDGQGGLMADVRIARTTSSQYREMTATHPHRCDSAYCDGWIATGEKHVASSTPPSTDAGAWHVLRFHVGCIDEPTTPGATTP